MNKKFRILAALMSLALCVGMLTACTNTSGGNNSSADNNSNSGSNVNSDTSGSQDTSDESTLSINTVAEVTAVNEDGSLELKIYSGSGNIADFAAVDFSAYTATEETETMTIPSDDVVFSADSGALTAAARSDIAVGDMLVISQDIDTDEIQQVVRYAAVADDAGQSGETSGDAGDTAGENSADNGTGEDAAA